MVIPARSLTVKIFLGTSLVVAAVLGAGLALTSRSANRAARDAIQRALDGTRAQVQAALAERERAMLSAAGVFVQSAPFRGIVESRDPGNALDQALEAVDVLGVDWVQITDATGVRLAKSDEPGAPSDTLTASGLIAGALLGSDVSGYGTSGTGDTLFQAVAVPIVRPIAEAGAGTVVGALMATRVIDSTFLATVRAATGGRTEIVVYVVDSTAVPRVAASSLPVSDELNTTLASWRPSETDQIVTAVRAELSLGGEHYVWLGAPLLSAGGSPVGGVLTLRSREAELAPLRALQRTTLVAGVLGLFVALALSFAIARQITRPVAALVAATRMAEAGDYDTNVPVTSRDEIGELAGAFRTLLADLRDKQALVAFLQGDAQGRTVPLQAVGATAQHAASAQGIAPGATIARRYHIKEVLGVGGMGAVYRAHDAELDEVVAIKALKPDILTRDHTALERFKSELRLARRISHRNVVRTHDIGEVDGLYFISMEFVEGKSLKELIRARGRLPAAATITIGKQLLRALEVAHEQGVIHRDIKPQNVVVTPDGVLKVMDFGIARLAKRTEGLTQAGMVVGTPEYMAPEQLLGDDVDARADVYAAGVVLYECLTGRVPFTADSPITLITKVLETPATWPDDAKSGVPGALAALVLSALEKDAAKRPQTATAFHDALETLDRPA